MEDAAYKHGGRCLMQQFLIKNRRMVPVKVRRATKSLIFHLNSGTKTEEKHLIFSFLLLF